MVVHRAPRGASGPFAGIGSLHGGECVDGCCAPGGTKALVTVPVPLPAAARFAFLLAVRRHDPSIPEEVLRQIFALSATVERRVVTRPTPPPPRRARESDGTAALDAAMQMLSCDAPP